MNPRPSRRSRRRFDVACRNPRCAHKGIRGGTNFVVTGKYVRKDGAVSLILRCDCGQHRKEVPDELVGLHQLSLSRSEHIRQQEKKAVERLRELRRQGRPLPKTISIETTSDGTMSLALRLVGEGRSPDDVAMMFSMKPGKAEQYVIERLASGESMNLGHFPMLAVRARELKRGDIDWNTHKSMRRNLRLWIERALAETEQMHRLLAPVPRGSVLPPLSWKEYEKFCRVSGAKATRAGLSRLNGGLLKSLTVAMMKRNLSRALRSLGRLEPKASFPARAHRKR